MSESAAQNQEYGGPDRRRHRVYVTKNTEYHFKDGFCIAVRDRRTGDFLQGHLALRRRVHGGLRFYLNGAIVRTQASRTSASRSTFRARGAISSRRRCRGSSGRPKTS